MQEEHAEKKKYLELIFKSCSGLFMDLETIKYNTYIIIWTGTSLKRNALMSKCR